MSRLHNTMLGIDTILPVRQGFEFEHCTVAKTVELAGLAMWPGARTTLTERQTMARETVAGSIELTPLLGDLPGLLPWILGGSAVNGVYSIGELVPIRFMQIHKQLAAYSYVGCRVQRAMFSGRYGEPLRLRIEVVGQSEMPCPLESYPALTFATGAPFWFNTTKFNLVGRSREVHEWSIVIDNHLEVSFENSTTATRITSRERTVTLRCTHPFTTDEVDLCQVSSRVAPATLALHAPAIALRFEFAQLITTVQGPELHGANEPTITTHSIACAAAGSSELTVVLDSA